MEPLQKAVTLPSSSSSRPHAVTRPRHQHLGPGPAGMGCFRSAGQLGHTNNLPTRAHQRKCPGRFRHNSAPSSPRLHSLGGGTVPVATNANGPHCSAGAIAGASPEQCGIVRGRHQALSIRAFKIWLVIQSWSRSDRLNDQRHPQNQGQQRAIRRGHQFKY